jgi:hypothetical protein
LPSLQFTCALEESEEVVGRSDVGVWLADGRSDVGVLAAIEDGPADGRSDVGVLAAIEDGPANELAMEGAYDVVDDEELPAIHTRDPYCIEVSDDEEAEEAELQKILQALADIHIVEEEVGGAPERPQGGLTTPVAAPQTPPIPGPQTPPPAWVPSPRTPPEPSDPDAAPAAVRRDATGLILAGGCPNCKMLRIGRGKTYERDQEGPLASA